MLTKPTLKSLSVITCARLLAAACALMALLVAGTADASWKLRIGLFDDSQTIYNATPGGTFDKTFSDLSELGTQVLRVNLRWDQVAANGPPAKARSPRDTAYDWTAYDAVITRADELHIQVLLVIYGTPRWVNRKGVNYEPRRSALRDFAHAASWRYSGTYPAEPGEPLLPRVWRWGAWNEPNLVIFLKPQWKKVKRRWVSVSPRAYARICNAIVAGVHSGQRSRPGELVACGLTAPHGISRPTNRFHGSHAPLLFLKRMKAAGAKVEVYAHHPYSPKKSPAWKSWTSSRITLGNIGLLVKEINRLYGKRKRLWITEYGWETNPPDRQLGVSQYWQSRWMKEAHRIVRKHPRIDLFIWFLLKDQPDVNGSGFGVSGWQSGLIDWNGRRKRAFATFKNLE